MAAPDLPDFDPRIIERFAESAYRKANAVFIGSVTAGVVVGAAFGSVPLTPLGAGWPIPPAFGFATMLVGAIVGGVIGYVVGETRSALCRLQGQTALAQVESAKHARAIVEAMREIHEMYEQLRGLTAAVTMQPAEPVAEPPTASPALLLTPLPPLRVADAGAHLQPPPVTPPTSSS